MSKAAAKRKEQVRKTGAKKAPRGGRSKATAKGLWVNWEFLRSLTRRAPQTIIPEVNGQKDNYYLKLADKVLGPPERRKEERKPAALRKTPAKSSKRKAR